MARGCGNEFVPKKGNQMFCSRKCFKKEYYQRKKEEEKNPKFPVYRCPDCGFIEELDFNPVDDIDRWLGYMCPNCGMSRDIPLNAGPSIEMTVISITQIITSK